MADAADWSNPGGAAPYRHHKAIVAHDADGYAHYPAVIAIEGQGSRNDEKRQLVEMLKFLRDRGRHLPAMIGWRCCCTRCGATWPRPTWTLLNEPAYRRGGFRPAPDPMGKLENRHDRGVTVTTIHQAKGREWDVVIVGSLDFDNREVDPAGRDLAGHSARPPYEPPHRVADFDHARQHYVAFSRARNMLVLTSGGPVHPRFAAAWADLPRWDAMDRTALERQRFGSSREVAGARTIPHLRQLDVWMRLCVGTRLRPA